MMPVEISVIVTLWNAEKTLRRCLDSLLAQQFSDFEVLAVNDGSTDSSSEILEEYARKDERIRVFSQENRGVSVSRQLGMDQATGRYVVHVDSDDWIEPDMFERMHGKAVAEDLDMVICGCWNEGRNYHNYHSHNPGDDLRPAAVIEGVLLNRTAGYCCNKLIRKSTCEGIRFSPTDIQYREDEWFILRLLCRDIKIGYIDEGFYHYWTDNALSLSKVSLKKTYPTLRFLMEKYQRIVEEKNLDAGCLYIRQMEILNNAFVLKKFKDLHLFPETRERYLAEKHPYRWKASRPFFLALALRGFPWIASPLYIINARLADFFA